MFEDGDFWLLLQDVSTLEADPDRYRMADKMADRSKRRQYGTGSVHQRSSDNRWVGSLDVGLTSDGKRRRISVTASTEAEVKRRLRARQLEIEAGVVSTASPRTTVKSWAEEWLEQTQHHVRPKTWQANRSAIRQWVYPTFGHKKVSQLVPADIENMLAKMREAKRSTATMSRAQNVINRMLKDAIIAGHRVHPGITLVKKTTILKSDRQAIPLANALSLLEEIDREPDPSRWVAVILNGMRQGERLGLTWECVDLDEGLIDVSWQLQELHYLDNRNKHLGFRVPDGFEMRPISGRWHLTRPKTKAGRRIIPMTKWMQASLTGWRQIAPQSPHDLVWCTDEGGPIEPTTDRSEWRRLQDQAVILHPTGRSYTVHEGRHTTVTLLKGLGVDDKIIEQIVGHSKLVEDYVHVDMVPKARAALEQLAESLALKPI